MIRRILRYLLTILCLLVIGAWGWSFRNTVLVKYRVKVPATERGVFLNSGAIGLWELKGSPPGTTVSVGETDGEGLIVDRSDYPASQSVWFRLGFRVPSWETPPSGAVGVTGTWIDIPLWMILLPLAAVTAWWWFRWLRERRMAEGAGFEVQATGKPE